ncbi:hypothetical protein ACSLBF_20350 (plasmid) [Pseudoalteromonas sp. T1lg65]|uniref:hypothetical protein n=1 Tax=Pseudoalteromonas sp. T1lg65 TaxID=2077101 RepID=UPI003F794864
MKLSTLILFFGLLLTVALSFFQFESPYFGNALWLGIVLALCFLVKEQENIKHIVIFLIVALITEKMLFQYLLSLYEAGMKGYQTNFYIYSMHFFVDLVTLLFIKYRVRLSLRYIHRFKPDEWRLIYTTYADALLYAIFIAFIVVDLAAFFENIIRNMEHFLGLSVEVAKPYWDWFWVKKSYPYVKSFLLSCVIATLIMTIIAERKRRVLREMEREDAESEVS